MAGIVTGRDAKIFIATNSSDLPNKGVTLWGVSDFTLSVSRDITEQELVGQTGNLKKPGKLSINGSFTNCKFAASGNSDALDNILNPDTLLLISGSVADSNLSWYFVSCQVTGFEVAFGDASTISEASINYTVLDPYNVSYSNGHISDS